MNTHTFKWAPNLKVEVLMDSKFSKSNLKGQNSLDWKVLEMKMFKMVLHDPFDYLQHKLWPKEGSGVKLSIWFSTTKSREYIEICACKRHVTYCWKALTKGYNYFINFTSIKGLHKKLWASKVMRVPISGLPTWESQEKWHLDVDPMINHKEYYKGEGGDFHQIWGHVEFCESMYACGLSMHQKCFNCALINLLSSLCTTIWIIDLLVILPSSHPRAPTRLFLPPKCYELGNIPQFFFLSMFSLSNSHLKVWGCIMCTHP
jgi:hypothetical protein